ncbi:hypothetical protein [Streptomyces sp. R08]|uniref:Uncharacterized protein n=1 Tax=Streptomyces sp. R08 TaxID=3238624 RepID=A0AB39M8I3_9ACTN
MLAADLRQQGIAYLLEAYRIFSYLTHRAGEMRTALVLLQASAQEAESADVVRRYAASPLTAVQLSGALGTAYSASGYLACNDEPSRKA